MGSAALALTVLSCAMEGYLYGVGRIDLWERLFCAAATLALMVPDRMAELAGLVLLLATFCVATLRMRARHRAGLANN